MGRKQRKITWIEDENGCWNCNSHKGCRGYKFVWRDGKIFKAHRFMWEQCFGAIPEGMFVCHKCDNPGCINPEHLFLGTPQDNVQDCIKKGRFYHVWVCGEKHGKSKLTERQVLETFNALGTYRTLAGKYGISRTVVCCIKSGKNWGWLTKELRRRKKILDN
jgi:hypothetical protein